LDKRGLTPGSQEDPLVAFLRDCLRARGLTKGWALKARALLDGPPTATPDSPHPS
jgi:hypothetical protein